MAKSATKHVQKKHRCEICQKRFARKWNVQNHMQTHEKSRQKTNCPYCTKTFYTITNLAHHCKMFHEGESLDWLSDPSNMEWHPNVMELDRNKPMCIICGKNFAREENLDLHMKSFHILKCPSFDCSSCKKKFKSRCNLKKHIRIFHSDEDHDAIELEQHNKGSTSYSQFKKQVVRLSPLGTSGPNEHDERTICDRLTAYQNSSRQSRMTTKGVIHIRHKEKSTKSFSETIEKGEKCVLDNDDDDEHLAQSDETSKFSRKTTRTSEPLTFPNPAMFTTEKDFSLPIEYWSIKNMDHCWNFKMIQINIYSKTVKPIKSLDLPQCVCEPESGCGASCLNRMVYFECNPETCRCGNKCKNTKIQKNITAPVQRFLTEDKGFGIRSNQAIKKGTFVLEYVGQVVDEREFEHRMDTIYKNDAHHYCLHLINDLVIDAHRKGNDCRFVNHSCEPNCAFEKWIVNGYPRMCLFSIRDIENAEEITFDYNFSPFKEAQVCQCKSTKCRGVIGQKSKVANTMELIEQNENTPVRNSIDIDRQLRSKLKTTHSATRNQPPRLQTTQKLDANLASVSKEMKKKKRMECSEKDVTHSIYEKSKNGMKHNGSFGFLHRVPQKLNSLPKCTISNILATVPATVIATSNTTPKTSIFTYNAAATLAQPLSTNAPFSFVSTVSKDFTATGSTFNTKNKGMTLDNVLVKPAKDSRTEMSKSTFSFGESVTKLSDNGQLSKTKKDTYVSTKLPNNITGSTMPIIFGQAQPTNNIFHATASYVTTTKPSPTFSFTSSNQPANAFSTDQSTFSSTQPLFGSNEFSSISSSLPTLGGFAGSSGFGIQAQALNAPPSLRNKPSSDEQTRNQHRYNAGLGTKHGGKKERSRNLSDFVKLRLMPFDTLEPTKKSRKRRHEKNYEERQNKI